MSGYFCRDCPRRCGAWRDEESGSGVCGMGTLPVLARAALHHWEEPCISGTRGSGAVFFSGCALGCVFCQNEELSVRHKGEAVSAARLREIYFELIEEGAHNINLVTPSHFVRAVAASLEGGLPVPAVCNCGGYESPEALHLLEGKIQVYLPDLKYMDADLARRCCGAPDYPETAKAAVREMVRQTGPYVLDGDGLLRSGVLIRHLVLPGEAGITNALDVIDWVADTFPPHTVLLSLMGQYLPCGRARTLPDFDRPLRREEYRRVEDYLLWSGFEDGYLQELSSADAAFIPDFSLQGVRKKEGD